MVDKTAFIFARGGSKGLPGKNKKEFNGKPLISHTIETAFTVKGISRVIVSTDDKSIASLATEAGAEVPFLRPSELSSDLASEWDAWKHAIKFIYNRDGYLTDPFISIPTTAPLRDRMDVEKCIDLYEESDSDIVITISESSNNPWFNMVKKDDNSLLSLVNNSSEHIYRRQDAPQVFDIVPVAYVANPKFILQTNNMFSGKVRSIEIPKERSVDIDTLLDFKFAEFISRNSSI